MITLAALIFVSAQAAADCPTGDTAAGRLRIRLGEPSCAEIAEKAKFDSTPPRKITAAEQRRIIAHFDDILVDGPSTRWRWGDVIGGSVACFAINSKNRMGGYTGWQRFSFDLRTRQEINLEDVDALLARLEVAPAKNVCG